MLQLLELAAEWRAKANVLLQYGDARGGEMLRATAAELETCLAASQDQVVTLTDASELSGYSESHLGRLVRDGVIPNAGRPNAPRIRLRDVPMKARRRELPLPGVRDRPHNIAKQIARAVVNSN
jgi:hypothetical protein